MIDPLPAARSAALGDIASLRNPVAAELGELNRSGDHYYHRYPEDSC